MNKRALVTGASSGIGKHLSEELAKKGYSLILVARRGKNLKEQTERIRQDFHADCEYFVCDLSSEAEVENLIKTYPDVDVLINNAGFGMYGFFHEMPWSRTRELIGVNVLAPVRLAHHYLPGMISRRRGKILNVASVAGLRATPFSSSYCGAKALMIQFSKSLALEINDKNVQVSCLLPGLTKTEFWKVSGAQEKVSQYIGGFDDPGDVAVFGINMMEKGMVSGIPGLKNKVKELMKNLLPEKIWYYLIKKHMTHSSVFAKKK
ncbi:MAG: SDR family oxidoreductase [Smithella sp.]|jgi:hypothetical protein